jgi:hypothetical protein
MTKRSSGRSTHSPRRQTAAASALTRKYARTILRPLGRKEAAVAIEAALEVVLRDGRVRRERVRVYGPFLRIEKPERRGGAPKRLIWVRVRDRDQGVVHEVSFAAGKVVEHAVAGDANPPFCDEERRDAYRLIAKDPALGRLVARRGVEIEWLNPGPHGGGRTIGARVVRVRDHRIVELITEASVDLDAGVLLESGGHR